MPLLYKKIVDLPFIKTKNQALFGVYTEGVSDLTKNIKRIGTLWKMKK